MFQMHWNSKPQGKSSDAGPLDTLQEFTSGVQYKYI